MIEQSQPILYSWTSPEFEKKERSKSWFYGVIFFAAMIFAAAIWMENYVFAITIPLFVFVIFSQTRKEPARINLSISEKGLLKNEEFLPFEIMKSFWIFEESDPPHINIKSKKIFSPNIFIPLGKEDVEKTREILKNFIPQDEQEESVADSLARKLNL